MIDVMTVLYQQIDGAHEHRTFNGRAPQKVKDSNGNMIPTPYPYVIYKLYPVDNTEKDRDDYDLEVSCWDKSESTSHVTAIGIAEKVKNALLHFREIDANNLIVTSRPSLGYIPDSNELIKRYDVTTTIMTYRRE